MSVVAVEDDVCPRCGSEAEDVVISDQGAVVRGVNVPESKHYCIKPIRYKGEPAVVMAFHNATALADADEPDDAPETDDPPKGEVPPVARDIYFAIKEGGNPTVTLVAGRFVGRGLVTDEDELAEHLATLEDGGWIKRDGEKLKVPEKAAAPA